MDWILKMNYMVLDVVIELILISNNIFKYSFNILLENIAQLFISIEMIFGINAMYTSMYFRYKYFLALEDLKDDSILVCLYSFFC